jgi:hypothetical protein
MRAIDRLRATTQLGGESRVVLRPRRTNRRGDRPKRVHSQSNDVFKGIRNKTALLVVEQSHVFAPRP